MSKRVGIIVGIVGMIFLGAINGGNDDQSLEVDANQAMIADVEPVEVIPTCDGTHVIANCSLEGVSYQTFLYHPAVAEKTRDETITTYREEISGYCTLCNDGTFSQSCATGRGACSHHGGVAQWNAPRYRKVPVRETRTVVDVPMREAYYEKVVRVE